jgi:hypothetical protein
MAKSIINVGITKAPLFYDPVKTPLYMKMGVTTGATDLPGFRYLVDVYRFATASTGFNTIAITMSRFTVPAQPIDGSGIFSPHRVLQSQIVSSVDPKINNIKPGYTSALKYKLGAGVGYDPEWIGTYMRRGAPIPASDWASAKKPAGVTYSSSTTYYYAEIYSNTAQHFLQGNSECNITLDNSFYLPYMQGKHQILSIGYSSTIFFTNLLRLNAVYSSDNWGRDVLPASVTASIPFISIVDDYTKMQLMTEDLVTYNSGKQQTQLTKSYFNTEQYDTITAFANYQNSAFLTKWDHEFNYKKIYRDQLETIDFLFYGVLSLMEYKVKVYNASMVELGTRYISFSPSYDLSDKTWHYYSVQVGYDKIMSQAIPSATASFPTAKYYTVSLGQGNAGPSNQHGIYAKYEIVDRKCQEFNTRLCWLNKRGGYDYFNFEALGERNVDIERREWTKQQPWNTTISDRSHSVFSTSAQETYTAVSDYLNDIEYNFLEDLIYSEDVYVIQEDGTKIPIVVTDTRFQTMNLRRDIMKIMTIAYKANTKLIV